MILLATNDLRTSAIGHDSTGIPHQMTKQHECPNVPFLFLMGSGSKTFRTNSSWAGNSQSESSRNEATPLSETECMEQASLNLWQKLVNDILEVANSKLSDSKLDDDSESDEDEPSLSPADAGSSKFSMKSHW